MQRMFSPTAGSATGTAMRMSQFNTRPFLHRAMLHSSTTMRRSTAVADATVANATVNRAQHIARRVASATSAATASSAARTSAVRFSPLTRIRRALWTVSWRPLVGRPAPERAASPHVGYWLLINAGLVATTVIVGGLTRLTESGLSMVDWSFMGGAPPQSQQEWEDYFEKYKQFPEYKLLNKNMTVEEFKRIYWFEYGHRMLGRVVGAWILLPGLALALGRKFGAGYARRAAVAVTVLIGCQGLLGWVGRVRCVLWGLIATSHWASYHTMTTHQYMVKSGLSNEIVEKNEVPRVSAYRLAAHLGCALTILALSVRTGFRVVAHVPALSKPAWLLDGKAMQKLRVNARRVTAAIFVTSLTGAFVAGLDGGMIYNTFPKMGDGWIPSDLLAYRPLYINPFENPATAQFNHRIMAISTYCAIVALWAYGRRIQELPAHIRKSLHIMLGVATAQVCLSRVVRLCDMIQATLFYLQVGLGITTLLWVVPTPLASSHQAGSLALLSSSLWALNAMSRIPK